MRGATDQVPSPVRGVEPLSLAQALGQIVDLITDDCWKCVLI